jgi:hypothetical protein
LFHVKSLANRAIAQGGHGAPRGRRVIRSRSAKGNIAAGTLPRMTWRLKPLRAPAFCARVALPLRWLKLRPP